MTHLDRTEPDRLPRRLRRRGRGAAPARCAPATRREPVVFLHGTSGHLEAFARNIAAHAGATTCHAIDMLGHGYTGKPDVPTRSPDYVEHLRRLPRRRRHRAGAPRRRVARRLGRRAARHRRSPTGSRSLQLLCAGGTVANPAVMERIRTSTTEGRDQRRHRADPQAAAAAHGATRRTRPRSWSRSGTRSTTTPDFVANVDNLLSPAGHGAPAAQPARPERARPDQRADADRLGPAEPVRRGARGARRCTRPSPARSWSCSSECGHWPQHEQAERYNAISLEFLRKAAR